MKVDVPASIRTNHPQDARMQKFTGCHPHRPLSASLCQISSLRMAEGTEVYSMLHFAAIHVQWLCSNSATAPSLT